MASPTVSDPTRGIADREGEGGGTLYLLAMGPGLTNVHRLPASGSLLIGRAEDADVRVIDAQASRQHARLHVGPTIEIEDLGSANGTRLRDQPLVPGARTAVAPGEAIAIGDTVLILQQRSPVKPPRRLCAHGYFETRLIEECARAENARGTFALVRLHAAAEVAADRIEAVLGPELRAGDVLGHYGPGEYEVLLVDSERDQAEAVSARLSAALVQARIAASASLAFFPTDGGSPQALFSHACSRLRGDPGGQSRDDHGAARAMVVENQAMRALYVMAERVAAGQISVLITGETGSGKELLATTIHMRSPRRDGPFVCLNCAAMPESLLESELFGHEKGAFTGAAGVKPGLLEAASGGTLFLDEVGELSPAVQAKLLRAIEVKEILRVGSTQPRKIDVRFVAATNRDLDEEVAQKTFRQDLFFRLNGITLVVPPLRERPDELPTLSRLFLETAARQGGRTAPALSGEALSLLRAYAWPGNIRELRNVMERALILCTGSVILPEHLPTDKMTRGPLPTAARPAAAALAVDLAAPDWRGQQAAVEKQAMMDALARCGGNQSRAAELLGMPRRTFCARLKDYAIPRPRG